jgi:hypothetical protein
MERHTDAIDMSAVSAQSDEDTVEIWILRPHEAYWRNPGPRAPDAVDGAAELDETANRGRRRA